MKSRINEVRNLQKIAGLLKEDQDFDLSDNPLKIKPLDVIFSKHAPSLLKGLKLRKRDKEDYQAYDLVKDSLQSIAKELGLDINAPYMEDEMFSGYYPPNKALEYAKEMFANELEEGGETLQEADDEDFDLGFNPLSQDRIKPQWMSRLNPELNGIEIYNDEENRLFVMFDKNTGQLKIINDWHGEDFDEVWGSDDDIRPDLLAQI